LYDRQAFDARLQQATLQTAQNGRPLSLIISGIDDFERVGARLGPAVSSTCVQIVVENMTRTIQRVGMFTARLDWNEFGMVLPATDAAEVWRMANNIVHSVRQLGLQHPIDAPRLLSVSVGIATNSGHFDMDGQALWVVADQAYHRARSDHGDRVATSAE
jgi:diguanylate cyclase (GGDEF)-like protein